MAWTNVAKNTAVIDNQEKGGSLGGWEYNEIPFAYNQVIDPQANLPVYYNTEGSLPSYSNLSKNSASFTNVTKS